MIFSMFCAPRKCDFEQKLVENGGKIQTEIGASFFVCFLDVLGTFLRGFGSQVGAKMAPETDAYVRGRRVCAA